MVSRNHVLMLTAGNSAPWVFFYRLFGGIPLPCLKLGGRVTQTSVADGLINQYALAIYHDNS